MKVFVITTKKGKLCGDLGAFDDPGYAFRSLSESNENVGNYNVIEINIKKILASNFPRKIHDGLKSDYYENENEE